jgi:hypothetical protein
MNLPYLPGPGPDKLSQARYLVTAGIAPDTRQARELIEWAWSVLRQDILRRKTALRWTPNPKGDAA